MVLTSSTHSKINSKEYLVLRIYLTPEKTSQKMAEFAYNKLNKKRAGIIYLNDESLSEYEKYFSTTFENLGGKTYSENFNYGETDFKTQLTKIKQWAPDCLYICGWDENGLIMKQAKELGLDVQYLGTMTFNSEDTIKNARSAAENAIFAEFAFNPDTKNENMKEFKQKYIQKYNKEPTSTTALFYDGMKILIETINEANTKDPKKVFETIINKDQYSSTTIEDISFDSNGDIILPITFKIIQNSQFVDYK